MGTTKIERILSNYRKVKLIEIREGCDEISRKNQRILFGHDPLNRLLASQADIEIAIRKIRNQYPTYTGNVERRLRQELDNWFEKKRLDVSLGKVTDEDLDKFLDFKFDINETLEEMKKER